MVKSLINSCSFKKNLVLLKELRQVNNVPTKRSISDPVSMMSGHWSETVVKKAQEDNTNSSDDEGGISNGADIFYNDLW